MDNKSFDNKRIAEGYAKDRPWLHPEVIHLCKSDNKITTNFEYGLDIGCGAGLSTKALKLICNHVTGVDISDNMISVCKSIYQQPDYTFFQSQAEEIQSPLRTYQIVTAAGVIDWVEKNRFLNNLKQIMDHNGLLCIYDFWITDEMIDCDLYNKWWHNEYLVNFPKPPKKEIKWSDSDLIEGFQIQKQVEFKLQHEFDKEAFIRFMMIQSNVNCQKQNHKKTIEEVQNWFERSLDHIFKGESRVFIFEGYSWYIRFKKY